MTFVLNVACDVGYGNINTAIDFGSRPPSLPDFSSVVDALYSAELRLHSSNPAAQFHCVLCLLLVDVDHAARKGRWVQLQSVSQLEHQAQVFVFDSFSPPSNRGTIPKVQFVVSRAQVLKMTSQLPHSADSMKTPRAEDNRDNVATVKVSPTPLKSSITPKIPSQRSRNSVSGDVTSDPMRNSWSASPTKLVVPIPPLGLQRTNSDIPATPMNPEIREFFFAQLCRASGSLDQISAQRLHQLFVENEMFFSTETFSDLISGRKFLRRDEWKELESQYTPVVDALYDRIASKSNAHNQQVDRAASSPQLDPAATRSQLQRLQEEEAKMMIRQAQVREEIMNLQRLLQEDVARQQKNTVQVEDRRKEWDVLQKFVALRLRQNKLRHEEMQINHQLSLL